MSKPLPKDIQEMKNDDTCCKFCGVSYLVFHEVKKLQARVAELEAQLKGAKAKAAVVEAEEEQRKRAEEKAKSAEKAAQEYKSAMEENRKEIEEAERRWKEMYEMKERTSAVDRNAAVNEWKHKFETAEKEWRSKGTRMYAEKERAMSRLKQVLISVEAAKDLLSVERQALQKMKAEYEDDRAKMMTLLGSTRGAVDRVAERAELADELERKMETMASSKEDQGRRDMERIQALTKERDEAAVEVDKARAAVADASTRIAALESELLRVRNENEAEVNGLRSVLEGDLKSKDATTAALRADLEGARKAKTALEATEAELRTELATARNQADASKREAAAMKEKMLAQGTDLVRFKADLSKLNAEVKRLETERDAEANAGKVTKSREEATQAELRHLRESKRVLEDQLRHLANQMADNSDAHKTQLEDLHDNHTKRMAELKAQHARELEEARGAGLREAEQVQQSSGALEAELKETQTKLTDAVNMLTEVRGQLASTRGDARKSEAAQRELEDQMSRLRTQLDAKQQEFAKIVAECNQLRDRVSELQDLRAADEDQGLEVLEMHLHKVSDKLRERDNEISILKQTIQAECEERMELMAKVANLQQIIQSNQAVAMQQAGQR